MAAARSSANTGTDPGMRVAIDGRLNSSRCRADGGVFFEAAHQATTWLFARVRPT